MTESSGSSAATARQRRADGYGNRVGEITLEGTANLLVLGAFLGLVVAALYMAVGRWMAVSQRWRGLVFGRFALLFLGSALVEGNNVDSHRFGSAQFNIAIFAALPVAFGLLPAPLALRFERVIPAPALRARHVRGYAPVVVLMLPAVVAFVTLVGNLNEILE